MLGQRILKLPFVSIVSNLFSLYFVYLLYLFISRFGFKSGICLLIAPVPVHFFSITIIQSVKPDKMLWRHVFNKVKY